MLLLFRFITSHNCGHKFCGFVTSGILLCGNDCFRQLFCYPEPLWVKVQSPKAWPFSMHLIWFCIKIWNINYIQVITFNENLHSLKVARSDFWVMILFNFEPLGRHLNQSDRKSNVTGVLEKDESFKWGTFHQDLSYQ